LTPWEVITPTMLFQRTSEPPSTAKEPPYCGAANDVEARNMRQSATDSLFIDLSPFQFKPNFNSGPTIPARYDSQITQKKNVKSDGLVTWESRFGVNPVTRAVKIWVRAVE
jgi:hypothetical protein